MGRPRQLSPRGRGRAAEAERARAVGRARSEAVAAAQASAPRRRRDQAPEAAAAAAALPLEVEEAAAAALEAMAPPVAAAAAPPGERGEQKEKLTIVEVARMAKASEMAAQEEAAGESDDDDVDIELARKARRFRNLFSAVGKWSETAHRDEGPPRTREEGAELPEPPCRRRRHVHHHRGEPPSSRRATDPGSGRVAAALFDEAQRRARGRAGRPSRRRQAPQSQASRSDAILARAVFGAWRSWAHDRNSRRHGNKVHRQRIRLYTGTRVHGMLRGWYRRACFAGFERAEGLPYSSAIKAMISSHQALAAVQLPRHMRVLVQEEALPVVRRAVQVYAKQLGARSRITRDATAHLDSLEEALGVDEWRAAD